MKNIEELKTSIIKTIDGQSIEAVNIAKKVLKNPEPGFREYKTSQIVKDEFETYKESGQEIPHVHVHLIPRSKDDSAGAVHSMFSEKPNLSESDIEVICSKLRIN